METETPKGEFFKYVTKIHAELGYESYVDCDFLAAAAALYPDCVKSCLKHSVVVEQRGPQTKGLTILLKDNASNKRKVKIVEAFHSDILRKLRMKMLHKAL